ncbi:pre-rRNA-processing protein TSR1 homolog [Centruroides sculpturatus]|uniref:pre-rRNA-processing protein TSR1 homolog n=1 Tax=Centruroides sculpturatus TaxID=218467 RepID=UPI000C6CF741|nr:pre-rRNA-processing protein TSR1 homolog [Centruroides sculpturatus]
MSASNQVVHRPGLFKQQNKSHKHGRHRSNRALEVLNKGRVSVKTSTKKTRQELRKCDRRNQLQQIRKNKRDDILMKKRSLGGQGQLPFLVVIVPLSKTEDPFKLLEKIKLCDDAALVTSDNCFCYISIPRFKQTFSFVIIKPGDIYNILDVAKIANTVLFLHSLDGKIDEQLLTLLFAQGLPSTTHVIQGLENVPIKRRTDVKKNVQNILEKRNICFFTPQKILGTLKVSGYIRGQPLHVNKLIHISGWGDFQLSQIDKCMHPHALLQKRKKESDIMIANTVLFLHSLDGKIDEQLLTLLFAQGLPSTTHVIQGLENVPIKRRTDVKKNVQNILEKRFPDEKLHSVDSHQEALLLLRFLGSQKQKSLSFRDHRAHMLSEVVIFEPNQNLNDHTNQKILGTLKVSGYIRGQPLHVNKLIHISGWGDFQLSQIDKCMHPHALLQKRKKESDIMLDSEDVEVLEKADASKQESLDSENVLDPMEGEQTWPTEEEIAEVEALQQKKTLKEKILKKKIPKGTSDYQATWIVESDTEDKTDESDDYIGDECEPFNEKCDSDSCMEEDSIDHNDDGDSGGDDDDDDKRDRNRDKHFRSQPRSYRETDMWEGTLSNVRTDDRPIVMVYVNNLPTKFRVDEEADTSLISKRIIDRIKRIKPFYNKLLVMIDNSPRETVVGIGNATPEFKLRGNKFSATCRIVRDTYPCDGTIGRDILERENIKIDHKGNRLIMPDGKSIHFCTAIPVTYYKREPRRYSYNANHGGKYYRKDYIRSIQAYPERKRYLENTCVENNRKAETNICKGKKIYDNNTERSIPIKSKGIEAARQPQFREKEHANKHKRRAYKGNKKEKKISRISTPKTHNSPFEIIMRNLEFAMQEFHTQIIELREAIDVLEQGKLSSYIIAMEVMYRTLREIQPQLPEGYLLIEQVKADTLFKFYQWIITVAIALPGKLRIFAKMPLKTPSGYFDAYEILGFPTYVPALKAYAYFKTEYPILALSMDRLSYMLLRHHELAVCQISQFAVCSPDVPIFRAPHQSCEYSLYIRNDQKVTELCFKEIVKEFYPIFRRIDKQGTWVFSTPSTLVLAVKCSATQNNLHALPSNISKLNNVGIIRLPKTCIGYLPGIILTSHFHMRSTVHTRSSPGFIIPPIETIFSKMELEELQENLNTTENPEKNKENSKKQKDDDIKYRGLKSFRSSPWDPKENLPPDYARIFQFENFNRTRKRILSEERLGVLPGNFVTLHVVNVPEELFESYKNHQNPLSIFGLLPYEQKMSLVNVVLKKHTSYNEPIKSKEPLIFHIGYRRFEACPIFSDHNFGKNHKFERFLQHDTASVASFYAPIIFPPNPVLVFKKEGSLKLIATGSVLNADPNRIIIKRVVLSGHPFKINRKSAIIRYMFFNRDDILWFKPVELRTKYGRRGHIKEPLGTHGHMKCIFDKQLMSQDTVLMNLYKRVFPKWTYNKDMVNSPLLSDSLMYDMEME